MESIEGDYHNFSSSSSHRLPTVSGAEAIRNARKNAKPIPTSLPQLDSLLAQTSALKITPGGGIQRGLVTEVFGPPGVGKTTFALQVAVNALHTVGQTTSVTWIDTSSQLVKSRLREISEGYHLPPGGDLPSSPPLPQPSKTSLLADGFNYVQITSLPRLLALFLGSNTTFPSPNTSLIVLDDLSNLILSSLPRSIRSSAARTPQRHTSNGHDAILAKRILSRRFQVLSSLATCMQKFAATNNVAILVTSKATVNLKAGQRAMLKPALTSQQWDNHLAVRIALYRDFWPEKTRSNTEGDGDDEDLHPTLFERRSLRFAQIVRLGGKFVSSREVGFVIEEGGLRELNFRLGTEDTPVLPLATQPLQPLEDSFDPGVNEDNERSERNYQVHEAGISEVPEVSGVTKRKAIEIVDSDDNEEPDLSSDDDQGILRGENENRSSPLLKHPDAHSNKEVSFSTAKKLRANAANAMSFEHSVVGAHTEEDKEENSEMLLEPYERAIPAFSQAGAEMSDPLTPSDDGRDLL